jgi:DNA-binding MarR family transcriptional regulator
MTSDQTGEIDAHPTDGLDEVVHQRVRLGILTITHAAAKVEFSYLLEALGLTGGNLSQHLRVLENAGLVRIEKGTHGRKPRTWVSITGHGRKALLVEIAALKAIVDSVEAVSSPIGRKKT